MNDVERRVDRLELDALKQQVAGLTRDVKALKPRKGFLAVLKDFSPLITPIVVALIGLYATISIKGAIEQKRLGLSQLTAIRELMINLAAPGAEPSKAAATAVSLAAFGPPAIVPLIHELQAEGQTRPGAAEQGLRTLAFQYSEEVCVMLSQVLEDRSRLFTWKTHRRVIVLLGDIGCADAVPVLERYRAMLEASDGLSQYQRIVSETPEPNKKSVQKLLKTLKLNLAKLER